MPSLTPPDDRLVVFYLGLVQDRNILDINVWPLDGDLCLKMHETYVDLFTDRFGETLYTVNACWLRDWKEWTKDV